MIGGTESSLGEQFEEAVSRVSESVLQALKGNGGTVNSLIASEPFPIYIKSVDGKVLLTNESYDSTFSDGASPVGRLGVSYLDDTIAPISRHSDAMILDGCLSLQFDHVGHDNQGRRVRLRSFKQSLLGLGHPTMAILGIAAVINVFHEQVKPTRSLREQWTIFKQLDELDRNIAIGLARGKNVSLIAVENGVTKKTIENHRAAILKSLGFNTPISVIKLVVRLQENGYGDFGV